MSINSEVGKNNKEKLWSMIEAAGYKNYRQFSKAVGIDCSNLYSNLDGRWNMSMSRMFRIADTLMVPIMDVIEIFYPEELEVNKNILLHHRASQ